MAENRLPDALPELLTLAADMLDGITSLQDVVYLKQNRAPVFGDVLDSTRTAQADYEKAQAAKYACTSASTIADSNVKGFIGTARDAFKPTLGKEWSPKWEGTGFPNGSLAVPETAEERQEHVRVLGGYLTKNPTLENVPLNVTALRAQALFKALSDARLAVRAANAETTAKRDERDQNVRALRVQMRGLIDELSQLIGENDGRWATFGLSAPGAPNRPDIPDGLVLRAGPAGSGLLYLDWDDAPRAERYRVWQQIGGPNAEFVVAMTVTDSDATLSGLPLGQPIAVRVTAANETGETKPCAPVAVTLT
jgi:hypothetical protein